MSFGCNGVLVVEKNDEKRRLLVKYMQLFLGEMMTLLINIVLDLDLTH